MNIISSIRSLIQPSYCSCCAESVPPLGAGTLAPAAFKVGVIETPLPGVPWRHVYSARNAVPGGPVDNNVSMDVFALADGTALVFGTGYGSIRQGTAGNARSVTDDVNDVATAMNALGVSDPTAISYAAPHGHGDHINAAFIDEMERLWYPTQEIAFHAGDTSRISALPGWTSSNRKWFTGVQATSCATLPLSYQLTDGYTASLVSRPGHTPGSIDMDIGNVTGIVVARILGSKDSTRCQKPPGALIVQAHGNGTP